MHTMTHSCMTMELEKVGSCVVIHMNFGKNVFNSGFVEALNEALDKALQ